MEAFQPFSLKAVRELRREQEEREAAEKNALVVQTEGVQADPDTLWDRSVSQEVLFRPCWYMRSGNPMDADLWTQNMKELRRLYQSPHVTDSDLYLFEGGKQMVVVHIDSNEDLDAQFETIVEEAEQIPFFSGIEVAARILLARIFGFDWNKDDVKTIIQSLYIFYAQSYQKKMLSRTPWPPATNILETFVEHLSINWRSMVGQRGISKNLIAGNLSSLKQLYDKFEASFAEGFKSYSADHMVASNINILFKQQLVLMQENEQKFRNERERWQAEKEAAELLLATQKQQEMERIRQLNQEFKAMMGGGFGAAARGASGRPQPSNLKQEYSRFFEQADVLPDAGDVESDRTYRSGRGSQMEDVEDNRFSEVPHYSEQQTYVDPRPRGTGVDATPAPRGTQVDEPMPMRGSRVDPLPRGSQVDQPMQPRGSRVDPMPRGTNVDNPHGGRGDIEPKAAGVQYVGRLHLAAAQFATSTPTGIPLAERTSRRGSVVSAPNPTPREQLDPDVQPVPPRRPIPPTPDKYRVHASAPRRPLPTPPIYGTRGMAGAQGFGKVLGKALEGDDYRGNESAGPSRGTRVDYVEPALPFDNIKGEAASDEEGTVEVMKQEERVEWSTRSGKRGATPSMREANFGNDTKRSFKDEDLDEIRYKKYKEDYPVWMAGEWSLSTEEYAQYYKIFIGCWQEFGPRFMAEIPEECEERNYAMHIMQEYARMFPVEHEEVSDEEI